jgi:hypothetical protein
MGFIASLSRAARLYGSITLAGALLPFAAIEGWRGVGYLAATEGPSSMPAGGDLLDPLSAALYLVVALVYLRLGYVSERTHRLSYLLLAGCNVFLATGGLYGLYAVTGRLIPTLPQYGPLAAACLTMSALLGAYLIFHHKTSR